MHERDRPHQLGMNNTVVKGLTEAEKAKLYAERSRRVSAGSGGG